MMGATIPSDAELLAVFDSDEARRTMHSTDVLEHLGLPMFQRRAVEEALDAMSARGLLQALSGARYRLPKKRQVPELLGYYTHNPRGFGFVAPEDGSDDIFVPATSIAGAMHGDRVAVRAFQAERGREGVVLRVEQRRPARVPGVLLLRGESAVVECDDPRVRGPIIVEHHEDASNGDAVLCEITRFPEHTGELPLGRVKGSLGRPGALDVEVVKVLAREGVEESFGDDTLVEARALPERLRPEDYLGREDLRDVPLCTIDPDDARDHDDAVYVRRDDHGGYIALVAVADVAHYVQPGTAMDRDARARGTSIYLPDRAIPMLPRELSSNLASLREGEDRLTLAVEAHVTPDGRISRSRVIEGVMRSRARLTYGNVARALGWSDLGAHSDKAVELLPDIEVAAELSQLLKSQRLRRGALELEVPEPRVRFAEDGRTPVDIVQSRKDPGLKRAYSLIEELMLLANEVIAQHCEKHKVPTVYRVHGGPEEAGLLKLCAAARALGYSVDPDDVSSSKKLSKFLRKTAKDPAARVLHFLLLRSLPQAQYSIDNTGHFGLASEAYLHFTSPIRRYPDVLVHRVVRQIARKERIRRDEEKLTELRASAASSSRLERRAMEVEREVLDLHRCVVAREHIGESFAVRITAVTGGGPYVQSEQPFLDMLVRSSSLNEAEWELDATGLAIRGRKTGVVFRVGQGTTVEIEDVSMTRRSVFARLAPAALDEMRVESKRGDKRKAKDGSKHGRDDKSRSRAQRKGGRW
ncbi:MAG: VacB/RNase II family 3'-5' exoribonuclease [Myxococcales bacterium]|nr:VacB/RNase II family 3'-5' exoribonuclease [Myxococcales bacterium]